jgi:hypothetical protein
VYLDNAPGIKSDAEKERFAALMQVKNEKDTRYA